MSDLKYVIHVFCETEPRMLSFEEAKKLLLTPGSGALIPDTVLEGDQKRRITEKERLKLLQAEVIPEDNSAALPFPAFAG
jgi:hypothetical protein